MTSCGICASAISGGGVACDGVCGKSFHSTCLKRGSKSSGSATCAECADIRPCHVLRLVRDITEAFSSDLSLVAEKVNSFSNKWSGLQLLSDDTCSLSAKVDKLLDTVRVLEVNSGALLERSHELSSRVLVMSGALDDVHRVLSDLDPGVASSAGPSPLLPLIDDIRRSVRQVRGDLSSWSSAVAANSDVLSSVASDVRALSSRCEVLSAPPPSGEADVGGQPVSPPLVAPICPVPPGLEREGDPPSAPPLGGGRVSARPGRAQRGRTRRSRTARGGRRLHDASVSTAAAGPVDDERTRRPVETVPVAPSSGTLEAPACPGALGLRPARRPKCVFISRVHPDTSERDIIDHISSRASIPDRMVACRRINSANGPDSRAFSASFKVFVPEDAFSDVVSPEIWPPGSIVREFVPRARPASVSHSKNLSGRSHSVMPT